MQGHYSTISAERHNELSKALQTELTRATAQSMPVSAQFVAQGGDWGDRPPGATQEGLVKGIITRRANLGPLPERQERDAVVVLRPAGLAVKARRAGPDSPPSPGRDWTRGEIYGFSKAARRRMLQKLSGLDWGAMDCYLVTLTYHEDWGDWQEWKAHLDAWRKRLERKYPGCMAGAVWRLEPQGRGSPHYHLCVFWHRAPELAAFRLWTSASWNAIAQPGDLAHLTAGTNVRKADNTQGPRVVRLLQYLGKYLAKSGRFVDYATGEILPTGRIWGLWHGDAMPWGATETLLLPWQAYIEFTRRVRRWGRVSHRLSRITANWEGFLILGDGPTLARLLRGLESVPMASI